MSSLLVDEILFNEAGLVPVIVQSIDDNDVLMMAWMNADSFEKTLQTGQVHYYSRSRQKIWRKGESSGQTQEVIEILLDCDGDSLLLKVRQNGVACHTGRRSCFYRTASDVSNTSSASNASRLQWVENQKILVNPDDLYDAS